jgi:HEPN domain-containing protein
MDWVNSQNGTRSLAGDFLMSKTKKYKKRYYDDDYDDDYNYGDHDQYRKRKAEKRIANALRSKNIDDLLDWDEGGYK